uniref:Uncharacterized protein n=1 Tax=Oryza barthii TaxID=65489 RepID=A0A0D3FCE0_9ORYZ
MTWGMDKFEISSNVPWAISSKFPLNICSNILYLHQHSNCSKYQEKYLRATFTGEIVKERQSYLQGLGPVFVGDGLRGDGGFSVHPLEHLLQFNSPSPSKAAEASSICIYERLVTGAIQRQVWQSMHR